MRRVIGLGLGAAALLALAGCEQRSASTPSRAQREDAPPAASSSTYGTGGSAYADGDRGSGSEGYAARGNGGGERTAREETPLFKGKPMWADNRKHSARENAEYQCGKHGSDLGATSLDDCLAKVHRFVSSPPVGTETATRARNGDTLMYDAKANLFAVARKDGAPRTFFKPREGAEYWREQKEEATSGRRSARRGGGDDDRERSGG